MLHVIAPAAPFGGPEAAGCASGCFPNGSMMTAPTSNDLQAADLLALARLDDDGAPAPLLTWPPVRRDRKRGGEPAQPTVPMTTANGTAGTA